MATSKVTRTVIICTLCCLLSTASPVRNIRDLRALLGSKCPLQCSGQLSNVYLARLCTCIWRPGAFIFGKRSGTESSAKSSLEKESSPKAPAVRDSGSREPMREAINMGASLKEERTTKALGKQNLIQLLNRLTKKSAEPSSVGSSNPASLSAVDVGKQLHRMLLKRQQGVSTAAPASQTTMDLFKSEIGKDIETATKEDFLNWVEKEMKVAELRLLKLMKFHEFIESTADVSGNSIRKP